MDLQERVHEELDCVLGEGSKVTADNVKEMVYLEQVHCPVPPYFDYTKWNKDKQKVGAFTFISLKKTKRNTDMTTDKHKEVNKVVSLERIVNWPFSFKLSLKIFVILPVLAHFIYQIITKGNDLQSQVISEGLRFICLPNTSRYCTQAFKIPDSDFIIPKGIKVIIPSVSLLFYQIGLLKKKTLKHIERPALKALKSVYNRWVLSYLGWFAFWPWILAKPGHIWSWSILGGEQEQPSHRRLSTIWIWT